MQDVKYANCFVCGTENPVGLKLDFRFEEEQAMTEFDCPACYEGYAGIIHGGIIATLMDEAMAKIILARHLMGVTAKMEIFYRKPLPVGTRIKVTASVVQQKSRTIRATASVQDAQGTVFAESQGIFIIKGTFDEKLSG